MVDRDGLRHRIDQAVADQLDTQRSAQHAAGDVREGRNVFLLGELVCQVEKGGTEPLLAFTRADIREQDRHPLLLGVSGTVCVDLEVTTTEGLRRILETGRSSRARDVAVSVEPELLVVRSEVTHPPAGHVDQARVLLERGIDL